jgi:hypothetical protein
MNDLMFGPCISNPTVPERRATLNQSTASIDFYRDFPHNELRVSNSLEESIRPFPTGIQGGFLSDVVLMNLHITTFICKPGRWK